MISACFSLHFILLIIHQKYAFFYSILNVNHIKVFSPASVSNVCCGFDVLGFSIEGIGDDIFIQKSNSKGIKIKRVTGYEIPIDKKKNTECEEEKELLKN